MRSSNFAARKALLSSAFACALTMGLLAAAVPDRAGAVDGDIERSFAYTGEEQTFTVPSGVHKVHVLAVGGRGSEGVALFSATPGKGGSGAAVQADIPVTPGQKLYVEVGGNGTGFGPNGTGGFSGGVGGFNGGGDPGSTVGGAGGGASDVRICSASDPVCSEKLGTEEDPRLLVAGGGGGGGGGGQISTDGNDGDGGWGGSADVPEPGRPGRSVSGTAPAGGGGSAGTLSAGGTGGFGASQSGDDGTAALGGDGGMAGAEGGGGGGGGYFGGGGGGAGSNGSGGGGGGAGSSFITAAASNTSINFDPNRAPRVVISYPQPAPTLTTVPASGLSTTGATLGAILDPSGADTTYRFEYRATGATSKTDTQQGTVASADGVRFVSASIEGLEPDTTYHYRPVATNSGGTTIGEEHTFTTPAEPPAPNAAPEIRVLGPAPRSKISDRTPTVRAKVADSQTDLSKADVRLWVDGRPVKRFSYERSRDRLSYTTPKLDAGRHTVLLVARDEQGLSSNRFWGFRVVGR